MFSVLYLCEKKKTYRNLKEFFPSFWQRRIYMDNTSYDQELSVAQMKLNNLMDRYVGSPIPTSSALVEEILDAQERVSAILNKKEASSVVFEKKMSSNKS